MFKLNVPGLRKSANFYHVKGSKHRVLIPNMNSDLALFIGMVYGDGWLVSRPKDLSKGRWNIGFVEGDVKVVKAFVRLAKKLFNVKFKLYPRIRKSLYYEARVNCRILYEFLSQNFDLVGGFKAKKIRIPQLIKKKNLIEPFIAGLISTDGSVRGSRIIYSSISKVIIDEIYIFLTNKGFKIKKGVATRARKNPQYILSISGRKQALRFNKVIFLIGKKRKFLNEYLSSFKDQLTT